MSPVVDVRTVSAQQASASVLSPPCASCCCCWQGLCKFQAFIRWQTDGRAGGMAWLAGSLKNAYDLCKQFSIRSALGSPWVVLVLQLRGGMPSWDRSICVSASESGV